MFASKSVPTTASTTSRPRSTVRACTTSCLTRSSRACNPRTAIRRASRRLWRRHTSRSGPSNRVPIGIPPRDFPFTCHLVRPLLRSRWPRMSRIRSTVCCKANCRQEKSGALRRTLKSGKETRVWKTDHSSKRLKLLKNRRGNKKNWLRIFYCPSKWWLFVLRQFWTYKIIKKS